MAGIEANFDGLIGPTHNYGGLSAGNVASHANRDAPSSPRHAAREGLAKMTMLADWGLVQGVVPPQERPLIGPLRALGFSGDDKSVWAAAFRADSSLARQFIAASPMWAANAATVSAGADAQDGRLHFTPANLIAMCHRSFEAPGTARALARLFPAGDRFVHHPPLPGHAAFGDEGAANHMRMAGAHDAAGVEIYVFGRRAFAPWTGAAPARQTLEASQAVARAHGLVPARTVFVEQSRLAIEAGAFHNDVVAVAHLDTLFFHEHAFADKAAAFAAIRAAAEGLFEPLFVEVPAERVSLADAIGSYLFNSQLLRRPGANRASLVLPVEARENPRVAAYVAELIAGGGPIGEAHFIDVRQSMRNGGGPACLRLRVPMSAEERAQIHPGAVLDASLNARLAAWIDRHYRESLTPAELGDPALIEEGRAALDALTDILGLGGDFYDFQRAG